MVVTIIKRTGLNLFTDFANFADIINICMEDMEINKNKYGLNNQLIYLILYIDLLRNIITQNFKFFIFPIILGELKAFNSLTVLIFILVFLSIL